MKNIDIINGTYQFGKNLPPPIRTPSALKKSLKEIKYF